MNRILCEVKLDFHTVKSSLALSAFMFVISFAIGILTKQPLITPLFVMIFGVFIGGTVFSIHEKNHIEKLYGILPLGRSDMIAGRYLYGLLIGLVNAVIAAVFVWVISIILNKPVVSVLLLSVLALAFFYYCFAVSISYPVYFIFGFAKANVVTMLPLYLIVIITMFVVRKTHLVNGLGGITEFLSRIQYLIPVIGLVAGLIVLTISALILKPIYAKKEI